MGRFGALKVRRKRRPFAAVVLSCAVAVGGLAACEYTYDDGRAPLPERPAPVITDPVIPRDPGLDHTVTGEALNAWVLAVLPGINGQTFFTSYGFLGSGESRMERTVPLPAGTYSITLACRGARQASYAVRDGTVALIELKIDCGRTRVNVVELPKSTVLAVTIQASRRANFAYRVTRI
ncbi:hypothetical protein [Arthrobacter cupressi]|uniref:Lipoprotein n=1 Tax=Arthrobacter cupressi TaxID=1045773 RepID=A0A1G8KFB2_9MICC|nr:hypothetical protein [Arthrobacter cupressi]NYD77236.1 hypothetical protein [Arthrobacter cupressi]SDI42086.1 hypothetical protein SAMN05216555_102232 [Arthrobacter cupressi]